MLSLYLCGQKAFGAAVFNLARELGHRVVGVSSPPWREGSAEAPDRLRAAAAEAGVPWMPAGMLKADTLPAGVDLILCAHSHDFVSRATRHRARLGAIGYHPSLLPRHRGRDAVRWAIHLGEPVTGGTVYWLSDNVDAGDIAAQGWCWIRPGDTPAELWRRDLFPLGLRLFARVLGDIAAGRLVQIPQDPELATWEPGWQRPPVHRPDLLMIGCAAPGFTVAREG